jgi:hypothetical protein
LPAQIAISLPGAQLSRFDAWQRRTRLAWIYAVLRMKKLYLAILLPGVNSVNQSFQSPSKGQESAFSRELHKYALLQFILTGHEFIC